MSSIDTTNLDTPTTRWRIAEGDESAELKLQQELGVLPLVARILVNRGITDPETAQRFLFPQLEDLHDPRLLPDYEPAVQAILGARERQEKIYVHGDYDVDGVSSTALLTRFLRRVGCDVTPHVPHRGREGYGIHAIAVESAKELGAKLFLTCDCGSSAHAQINAARESGMQVVVTDHHEVPEELPTATAIVNVHRKDSQYPFADLAGVGVAFKLCAGLTKELGHPIEGYYRAFLDLAVLGTVSDVMPLVDENRIITRFGLARLEETKKPGLLALLAVANVKKINAHTVGFQLGPRINAAGRIDDSEIALQLLLEDSRAEADRIAAQLNTLNTQRKEQQLAVVTEAELLVQEQGLVEHPVIVVACEGWSKGVVGLAAGRLRERYNRPVFVLNIDPQGLTATGSVRSVPEFNIVDAINAHRNLVISGGGHALAAGVSVELQNLDAFREAMCELGRTVLKPEDFAPCHEIDLEVQGNEADIAAALALESLEPFGRGNEAPIFCSRNVLVEDIKSTANSEIFRIQAKAADGASRCIMAFFTTDLVQQLKPNVKTDLLFKLEENRFNGTSSAQWNLIDVRPSAEP